MSDHARRCVGDTEVRHPAAGLAAPGQPRRPGPPDGRPRRARPGPHRGADQRPGTASARASAERRRRRHAQGVDPAGPAHRWRWRSWARCCWPRWSSGDIRRVAWSGRARAGHHRRPAWPPRSARSGPDAIEEPRYEGLLVNAPGGGRRRAPDRRPVRRVRRRSCSSWSPTSASIYATVSTCRSTSRAGHHARAARLRPAPQPDRLVDDPHGGASSSTSTSWSTPATSTTGAASRRRRTSRRSACSACRTSTSAATTTPAVTAAAVARQPNAIVLDNTITTVAGLTIAGIGDPRFTPDKEPSADRIGRLRGRPSSG